MSQESEIAKAGSYAIALDLAAPDTPDRPTVARARATARANSVTAARDGRRLVALIVLSDGRAYTVPDTCPHDGGLLSDGYLEDQRLVCSRHGRQFDVSGARCPLRVKPVS